MFEAPIYVYGQCCPKGMKLLPVFIFPLFFDFPLVHLIAFFALSMPIKEEKKMIKSYERKKESENVYRQANETPNCWMNPCMFYK